MVTIWLLLPSVEKIGKYLLPKDTNRGFKHDRGTISMPSSDIENPHKLASPYQFFIVQQKRRCSSFKWRLYRFW